MNDSAARSGLYSYEIDAIQTALKTLEGMESAEGPGWYVTQGEIRLATDGEQFAALWYDPESDSWRASIERKTVA